MKLFVITLKSATERRASIRAQLASLGVDYTFFDAIDGQCGLVFFDAYDEARYLVNTGRTVSPGEIGCFASHLSLWKRCVAMNEPIVIMEDDARVETNFPAALTETEKLIEQHGYIRLQTDGRRRKIAKMPVQKAGEFTLNYYANFPYGSMCYSISPGVATSFIDQSRVLTGPLDLFIKQFWVHGHPLFALSPHSVTASDHVWLSTINKKERDRPEAGLRALRVRNKLKNRLDRAKFNFSYRFGSLHKV